MIFGQELARLNLPVGCNVLGVIMTGPALMQWGTEEQKQRYLQPILSGEEIWCEGMSEPGAGSDLAAVQTRAVLDGDNFVVDGQKIWTTLAHRSHFCQLFVRTDPTVPQHKGMSCLLVDMKTPRRDGQAAAPDHRRIGIQRNLLRGRARAERKSARTAERRMAGAGCHPDA